MVRMKEDQFDDVIRTNLKGAFNMLSLCGAMMMRAKQGRIINITSVSAFTGNYGQINYTAAKAGMVGMTKTAAKELGARGITVNAVAPGWIATEMSDKVPEDIRENAKKQIALGRFGKPEEIAGVVAFLALTLQAIFPARRSSLTADFIKASPDNSPAALCGNFPL